MTKLVLTELDPEIQQAGMSGMVRRPAGQKSWRQPDDGLSERAPRGLRDAIDNSLSMWRFPWLRCRGR
jgi:hypothetical protein